MVTVAVRQPARPHVWNVPSVFLQARMYPIIDKSAVEMAAMKEYVEDLDDPTTECAWLGFAPCQDKFEIRPSFGGTEPCRGGTTIPHGHLIHWGDSGTAILQAPISSQPFFDFAMSQLPRLGHGFGFPEKSVPVFTALFAEERIKLLPKIAVHEQPFLEGDRFVTFVTEQLVWIG